MAKLVLTTEAEAATFWEEADKWYKSTEGRFSDVKSASIMAVAEFLANRQGKTLLEFRAPPKEE